MLLYILLVIIVLVIVLRCYLRIKMRFWSLQPVFHIYNLRYWVKPPGVINTDSPVPLSKFVNIVNVHVCAVQELSEVNQTRACQLIHDHYIGSSDARVKYTPTMNNIMPYLQHNNGDAFMGIYFKPCVLFEKSSVACTPFNDIHGVITARPLDVHRYKKNKMPWSCLPYGAREGYSILRCKISYRWVFKT